MHLKRWITGIVALPFLVYLIYTGGIGFALLITSAALLALWEYFRITLNSTDNKVRKVVTAIGYLTALSMTAAAYRYTPEMVIAVTVTSIILSSFMFLFFFSIKSSND